MTKLITLPSFLSNLRKSWESVAVVEHETGLPSDPLVRTAFKAIADWVNNYRRVIGLTKEFDMCRPDEVMRMAKEIGMIPSQLHELSKGQANADLLTRILVALHVDPKVLADMDPLIVRELKWLCITCSSKKRCSHELAKGTAAENFHEFCPNAVSLNELLDQKGQLSSQ